MRITVFIILSIFLTEFSMFGIIIAKNAIEEYNRYEKIFSKRNIIVTLYLMVIFLLWYLLLNYFIFT